MPLSEHEQRMLEQIERALYAEDPKFANTVQGGRLSRPSRRRRMYGIAVFALGLVLLVLGVVLDELWLASIPVMSVVGFLVMFGGGALLLTAWRGSNTDAEGAADGEAGEKSGGHSKPERRSSFGQRMEERFRRRFDQ